MVTPMACPTDEKPLEELAEILGSRLAQRRLICLHFLIQMPRKGLTLSGSFMYDEAKSIIELL